MMALILVSLLASFASGAVVDLSPETQVDPTQMVGGDPFPEPKP